MPCPALGTATKWFTEVPKEDTKIREDLERYSDGKPTEIEIARRVISILSWLRHAFSSSAFSALTLLVGRQEEHPTHKN